jgi:hypothetical protein
MGRSLHRRSSAECLHPLTGTSSTNPPATTPYSSQRPRPPLTSAPAPISTYCCLHSVDVGAHRRYSHRRLVDAGAQLQSEHADRLLDRAWPSGSEEQFDDWFVFFPTEVLSTQEQVLRSNLEQFGSLKSRKLQNSLKLLTPI